jgi:hypothetical protein
MGSCKSKLDLPGDWELRLENDYSNGQVNKVQLVLLNVAANKDLYSRADRSRIRQQLINHVGGTVGEIIEDNSIPVGLKQPVLMRQSAQEVIPKADLEDESKKETLESL